MDELEDLHTDQIKVCFYRMEFEGEVWDPVMLRSSSYSLLIVSRRYFHCFTSFLLLCSVSLSNNFFYQLCELMIH